MSKPSFGSRQRWLQRGFGVDDGVRRHSQSWFAIADGRLVGGCETCGVLKLGLIGGLDDRSVGF